MVGRFKMVKILIIAVLACSSLCAKNRRPEHRERIGVANSQIFYKTARIADQAALFPLSIVYDKAAYKGKPLSSYTLNFDRTAPFLRHKVVGDTEETIPFQR